MQVRSVLATHPTAQGLRHLVARSPPARISTHDRRRRSLHAFGRASSHCSVGRAPPWPAPLHLQDVRPQQTASRITPQLVGPPWARAVNGRPHHWSRRHCSDRRGASAAWVRLRYRAVQAEEAQAHTNGRRQRGNRAQLGQHHAKLEVHEDGKGVLQGLGGPLRHQDPCGRPLAANKTAVGIVAKTLFRAPRPRSARSRPPRP